MQYSNISPRPYAIGGTTQISMMISLTFPWWPQTVVDSTLPYAALTYPQRNCRPPDDSCRLSRKPGCMSMTLDASLHVTMGLFFSSKGCSSAFNRCFPSVLPRINLGMEVFSQSWSPSEELDAIPQDRTRASLLVTPPAVFPKSLDSAARISFRSQAAVFYRIIDSPYNVAWWRLFKPFEHEMWHMVLGCLTSATISDS